MRKATLFLIVAAITLWTGTVAWSMPQEKKQDANSNAGGTNDSRNANPAFKDNQSSGSMPTASTVSKPSSGGSGQNKPKKSVEYKDPEDTTTRRIAKPSGSGGNGSTGTGQAGLTERKPGKDQNAVAGSGEVPKETLTGTTSGNDTQKKKTKPHNPPPSPGDGAAKGQAQEGVMPNPHSGNSSGTGTKSNSSSTPK